MKKTRGFLFTAGILLAMVFTFSCSSDDGGGGGNGGGGAVTKAKIGGVSQKGPFLEGSAIALYELKNDLAQTGKSFKERILDSKGSFEINSVELISPYAMLEASGYYRNEVTGGISSAPVTLFAISDIREKDNVNINILTHLEYYRVLNLAEQGKSVKDAKTQAQREIFEVFDISGEFGNSEDMSIFGTGEGDAALLAISILLQGDLGEGEFSQRLMNFSQAINTGNGVRNNEAVRTAMADWASGANLEGIRDNIFGWRLSSNVPSFEKYIRNFVSLNYGLGPCDASNEGVVKKNNNEASRNKNVVCKGGIWKVYEGIVEPSSSSDTGIPSSSSESDGDSPADFCKNGPSKACLVGEWHFDGIKEDTTTPCSGTLFINDTVYVFNGRWAGIELRLGGTWSLEGTNVIKINCLLNDCEGNTGRGTVTVSQDGMTMEIKSNAPKAAVSLYESASVQNPTEKFTRNSSVGTPSSSAYLGMSSSSLRVSSSSNKDGVSSSSKQLQTLPIKDLTVFGFTTDAGGSFVDLDAGIVFRQYEALFNAGKIDIVFNGFYIYSAFGITEEYSYSCLDWDWNCNSTDTIAYPSLKPLEESPAFIISLEGHIAETVSEVLSNNADAITLASLRRSIYNIADENTVDKIEAKEGIVFAVASSEGNIFIAKVNSINGTEFLEFIYLGM
jgi:hypothetical protein